MSEDEWLRLLPAVFTDDSGLPFVWRPGKEPSPHARRLMATLGIQIEVRGVSAQEITATTDCIAPGCPLEAEPRSSLCRRHNRKDDPLTTVITKTLCPEPGCLWEYEGTELRGTQFLARHTEFKHGNAGVNGAAARPDIEQPAIVPVLAPSPVVKPKREAPRMDIDVDDAAGSARWETIEDCASAYRHFHRLHGRWPTSSDDRGNPDLPGKRVRERLGISRQLIWDLVGAGKVPTGRAAAKYLQTGVLSSGAGSKEKAGTSPATVEFAGPTPPLRSERSVGAEPSEPAPEQKPRQPLRNDELRYEPDLLQDEASYLLLRSAALSQLARGIRQLNNVDLGLNEDPA